MVVQLFSVPAFFILFRETLEAAIILSVMLILVEKIFAHDPSLKRRMQWHVWLGVLMGVVLSLAAATIFVSLYYTVAKHAWENSEPLWEGILSLISVILITLMAFSMFRVDTWKAKWEKKLTKVTVETSLNLKQAHGDQVPRQPNSRSSNKYALFLLPLSIVVREGVEALIFLAGVGLQGSAKAVPIPAVLGALCGILTGYLLYKGGRSRVMGFKWFLLGSSILLLLIAAGLFAGSVHEFEEFYTHDKNQQHYLWLLRHCCDENQDGIWKILNAIVGWRDEATVGTLVSYISYWVFVAFAFTLLCIKWRRDAAAAERQGVHMKTDALSNKSEAAIAAPVI
jgi:high-affinity iron transporter